MIKKKLIAAVTLLAATTFTANADEGMWLMQLAEQQHLQDSLRKAGSSLTLNEIYSENAPSLKDAIGIFGRGCTGEIVSPNGLVFTNNHCGLSWANSVSTTSQNIVKDGFFAKSFDEEIRIKGLTFTFVRKVVDVTAEVKKAAKKKKIDGYEMQMTKFLSGVADDLFEKSGLKKVKGMTVRLLPFYRGTVFYMFYEQVYSDVRLVSNLPMNIGQFGGGQDNWMWPRQNCDFAAFRVYADKDGLPASYSKNNVPLKCDKYLKISIDGVKKGDYTMIMGFPGRTSRFLTSTGVAQRVDVANATKIIPGNIRLAKWKAAMDLSDSIYLKYLDKNFSLQNVVKNSEGMNLAVVRNGVMKHMKEVEDQFNEFAKTSKNKSYRNITSELAQIYAEQKDSLFTTEFYNNSVMRIENGCPYLLMKQYAEAFGTADKEKIDDLRKRLNKRYAFFHSDDYDAETDKTVAKAMIPLFPKYNRLPELPEFYNVIKSKYNGNIDAFIDDIYDNSICSNRTNFDKWLDNPASFNLEDDPGYKFSEARSKFANWFSPYFHRVNEKVERLNTLYTQGLYEMYNGQKAPDANFTMRMTYGHVTDLKPKDAVKFEYYTTLEGMFEKENPNDSDYVVNEGLRELYAAGNYGRYADKSDGRLHTCFLSDNDITGGNSGSPVLNKKGELIGLAFDGNFESLSSDLEFCPKVQRCVNVDIRYVLYILEKYGKQNYLFDEMDI